VARVDVLDFDLAAVEHAGQMRADLASGGRPIGPYDLLIASHARSRGLRRATNNVSEFERVIGLRLVNWVN
jgi:tRNA(fMet)-specific endonuclease VapC